MKGQRQTEARLLEVSSCRRLEDIIELDLTDCGMDNLDTDVFNKLTSLRSLYVSCNQIRAIPPDLQLDSLEVLDISHNALQSVEGVEKFPMLRELCIDGNKGISVDDSYIALVLCPELESLDGGTELECFHSGIHIFTEQLRDPMRSVWDAMFAEVYGEGVPDEEIDTLHKEFVHTVQTASIVGANLSMAKFRRFMIQRLAYQLISDVNDGVVGQESRRTKRTPVPATDSQSKYSTRTSRGSRPAMDYSSGTPVKREHTDTPTKNDSETSSRKRKRADLSPETPTHSGSKRQRDTTPVTHKQGNSSKRTPKSTDSSKTAPIHSNSSKNTPKHTNSSKSTPKQTNSSKNTPKHTNSSKSTPKHTNSSKNTQKHTNSSKSTPKRPSVSSTTESAGSSSKHRTKTSGKTSGNEGKRKVASALDFTELKEKLQLEERSLLDATADFDPSIFLRCHSEDNDPTDHHTKIWKCAFEPQIGGRKGETTTTLATCGGNIVCFIDCVTGKVMRRYKDSSDTESFYTLAWTTLQINGQHVNILAVAGQDGQIKLIHPTQLVIFGIVGRHRCYINALLFHPDKPNILFSSAMDNKVFMWDIAVPDLKDYSISAVKRARLSLPKTDAVSLVYSPGLDVLVAGCDNSCYAWTIADVDTSTPSPHYEFIHPVEDNENGDGMETIDGLVLLSNNCIVSKCVGHSCLYLWDLRQHVAGLAGGGRKAGSMERVPVRPLALMEYTPVTVDYIYPSAIRNVVMVGDDRGRVHMYDLSRVVKKKKPSDDILTSSMVLEYPDINIEKNSRQMTDVTSTRDDVVVNCIAMSSDSQFLVYGTDNNLVCVWSNADKL